MEDLDIAEADMEDLELMEALEVMGDTADTIKDTAAAMGDTGLDILVILDTTNMVQVSFKDCVPQNSLCLWLCNNKLIISWWEKQFPKQYRSAIDLAFADLVSHESLQSLCVSIFGCQQCRGWSTIVNLLEGQAENFTRIVELVLELNGPKHLLWFQRIRSGRKML